MADPRMPASHPRAQPFAEGDAPADDVTLTQPKLLATPHNLRGSLHAAWRLDRRRRALAQRYGEEMAEDEVAPDEGPLLDEWDV
jgi:hypothetical protein